ncbi:enhanced level of genomic instability 1 [Temnothorax americanus]|uniref:enhanced level of genomic instability 1 n=1 Tax=Temnothorax americanus TaxID=1964332 RepID=UPI0040675DCB
MKDIERYFANGKHIHIVDKEAATDSSNVAEQEKREQEETTATGKRERVEIRMSRDSSASRMCDIIESKGDLIDETPIPFNGDVNNGHKPLRNETPKSEWTESDVKRRLEKPAVKIYGNRAEETKNVSKEDGLDEQIVDTDSFPNNSVINFSDETESNVEHSEIDSQREESNAFQVLMSRSKPIRYKLPRQSTEDYENKDKSDNAKELKSKYKEKLIALADKKGYSKRKMAEIEEGERIEKNIENRTRVFKGENKTNVIHKKDNSFEASTKSTKQSGNLLNYFSKSSLGLTNKDEECVSTFIVKADVHRTDNSDVEPVIKPISNKRHSNKKCPKSELDLSTVDDIHIVASENLFSPQTAKQDKQKREKPRWSLRIKLHSSEDNGSPIDTDDELFSPRSKSKFNPSNKSGTIENNEVYMKDCDRHLKRMRNKEKKKSIVEDNVPNTVKDVSSINASNEDADLKKSNETSKNEQKINDTSETIITVIDDCEIVNENVLKRKPNEKLAPLFIKRRKTDPAITAARRLFLQSDTVDVENKNTDHKANNGISVLPFPSISHVAQLENESDSTRCEIKHKFSMKIEKKYLPLIDIGNYKYITNCRESSRTTKTINEPVKENVERVLSEIEKLYPDVRKIWKTITMIKGNSVKKSPPRMRGRKRALERRRTLMESEESQLHDCMWTYKYKPMSAQEIVGNEEAANKLKDWLSGWRTSLTKENDGSSGDEFYSSDCSSSCNNENNQIAVLLGPHGSGKSASVYAIAEELGYSVLEVNASSRRTGKRILKELEEATKSHRIKKSKHKSPFERVTGETESSKSSQNSLILLEDIDIIFEEDEGFVSAAYQLASNTKRPIVMICRDTCPHLNKMAPQQNKVYFYKVSGNRVSALLELISLAETGYRIPHNCLTKLVQAGDLRQALLQLQYLLLSGPPVLSEQSTTTKPSLWQDMQHYLYKPAIELNKRHKTKKSTNTKNSNILNNLAEDLDSLSLVSSLIDVEDTTLDMPEENAQPNLSLAENVSFYSALRDLNADIANFINSQILYKNFEANEHVQNQSKIILRKQLKRGVDLALSYVTSGCLDQRIMALDYLPTVRTICRAEESRSTANYKRRNRFFHYLHSLVPTASTKPNILAAACRMLQERENKTTSNVHSQCH